MHAWGTCNGKIPDSRSCVDLEDAQERFSALVWLVHRVNLHHELLHLALDGRVLF